MNPPCFNPSAGLGPQRPGRERASKGPRGHRTRIFWMSSMARLWARGSKGLGARPGIPGLPAGPDRHCSTHLTERGRFSGAQRSVGEKSNWVHGVSLLRQSLARRGVHQNSHYPDEVPPSSSEIQNWIELYQMNTLLFSFHVYSSKNSQNNVFCCFFCLVLCLLEPLFFFYAVYHANLTES